MRLPSWRKSWKLRRTQRPSLPHQKAPQNQRIQLSQKTRLSQKAQPTRLFTLIGSCHPSLPRAPSPLYAFCSNLRLRHALQHRLQ